MSIVDNNDGQRGKDVGAWVIKLKLSYKSIINSRQFLIIVWIQYKPPEHPVGYTLTPGSGPVVVYQPVLCYYIPTSRTSCGVYFDPAVGACGSLSACVVLLYTNL